MSTDTLDSLSNADLNGRFATVVLGLTDVANSHPWEFSDPPDDRIVLCGTDATGKGHRVPDVATSVDAVLPWLDKGSAECHRLHFNEDEPRQWSVEIWQDGRKGYAVSPTLARAAVIALLRAAAAKGGESS